MSLAQLTRKSIQAMHEILDIPLDQFNLIDPEAKHFKREIERAKLKLYAAERVLQTQVRVDQNELRKREIDVLPRLLAIIAEEKKLIEAPILDLEPADRSNSSGP